MKAVLFTLGCKVNECESASLSSALEKLGYEVTDELCNADLYIINTCAVTREAESKSRQVIARVRKFNELSPIYVCGCAAEKNPQAFLDKGVTLVTGAKRKDLILSSLGQEGCFVEKDDKTFENLPAPKAFRTRTYLKIQDGCNRFCSYCIIPFLRGRTRSKSIEKCLEEINACPSEEIVLTGIDLSSYRDGENDLADLLLRIETSRRIRLGSLEESVITDKFLSACKNLKNFAPQFHLSLQSGSTSVLKSMNRKYTREEFLSKCDLIYSYFPHAAITTDIIAGFPTETEEDFKDSLSIIHEGRFAQVHSFAFSPREGTNAAKMKDLPGEIKNERVHRLLEEGAKEKEAYLKRQIGQEVTLLCEEQKGDDTVGYTENYMRAYLAGKHEGMVKVKVKELFRDGVRVERI